MCPRLESDWHRETAAYAIHANGKTAAWLPVARHFHCCAHEIGGYARLAGSRGGVFDDVGNRISSGRGRMRAQMRRNAGARFFMDFWWSRANRQRANVSSVEWTGPCRRRPVWPIESTCRAAMRVFRSRIFLEHAVRGCMRCAALTRNSNWPRSNADANHAAIAHSMSIAVPGSVCRCDVMRVVPIPQRTGSRIRSHARPAVGPGGRVFTDRHAFPPR